MIIFSVKFNINSTFYRTKIKYRGQIPQKLNYNRNKTQESSVFDSQGDIPITLLEMFTWARLNSK